MPSKVKPSAPIDKVARVMLITITVSIVALRCTTSLNTKPDGFAQIFGKLPMHESALLTFIQRLEVHFRSLQEGQPDARNRLGWIDAAITLRRHGWVLAKAQG